jgi:uncharacterized membrane protein (DUF485 family)
VALFQPAFQPALRDGGDGSTREATAAPPARVAAGRYAAAHASRDFPTIRRRPGSFIVRACALSLTWHLLCVISAVLAPGFLRTSVLGDGSAGLRFGVLPVRALTGTGAERPGR